MDYNFIPSFYRQCPLASCKLPRTVTPPCLENKVQAQPVCQGPLWFGPGLFCFIDHLVTSIYGSLASLISQCALNL